MNKEVNTKINFKSEAFKKYFANTSWLFFERIFRLIVTFAVGILLVRYLGPNNFGLLSYAISFVGLFSAIGILGLESLITRELVNAPEKRETILGTAFILRIAGSLLSIILIYATAIVLGEDRYTLILIMIVSLMTFFQSFNVVDFYFQSIVKAKYSVYVLLTMSAVGAVVKIILILLKTELIYFAVITAFEYLIMAIGYVVVYFYNKMSIFSWKFDYRIGKKLLNDSWPLILSGLAIAIYMKIGQVMIKNMMNNEEVGYYAAAVRLCEAWYFIPMAVTSSLFPAIVNAKKISEELYNSRLQKLYDVMAWISIGIAIPITVFSEQIVKILLGVEYLPSASVLTIYIWAGVPTFLGVASSQFLITENLTKVSFYRTLIGMIINVVLNYLFIPIWGIIGSALATLISYSFATFSIATNKKGATQLPLMIRAILLIDLLILIKEYGTKFFRKN